MSSDSQKKNKKGKTVYFPLNSWLAFSLILPFIQSSTCIAGKSFIQTERTSSVEYGGLDCFLHLNAPEVQAEVNS